MNRCFWHEQTSVCLHVRDRTCRQSRTSLTIQADLLSDDVITKAITPRQWRQTPPARGRFLILTLFLFREGRKKKGKKRMQWMIFFSPSGFLGNGEQVGGRWESLLTGGLVSHPDGSRVYFAPVLHLITGASVTGFSGGGRKRRRKWDTSHEPKKTTTLSPASALLSQDTSCNTSQNHPCFF